MEESGMLWWIVCGALLGWVGAWWLGRSTQRLLTEPVIRIVERRVDNPQHTARIAALEAELAAVGAQLAGAGAARAALRPEAESAPELRARIDALQSAPPKVIEKVVTRTVDRVIERPVERIVERIVEKPVERIVEQVVVRTVPDAAAIAERDAALRAQRLRLEHLEALAAVQAQRLVEVREAARAGRHGFAAAGDADIEIVEGIGPKIAEVLRARGLGSFGALALASPGTLREILDDTGPAYRIADPSTWPEQAQLAADGRWDELRSLQDTLRAGRR
jgi:predicted flap endonuclease-1-like 5' DNA nuclease